MASVALWFFWLPWLFGILRLLCSQLLSSLAPGLLRLLCYVLLTVDDHADAALDAAHGADFDVADDQAAGIT